MKGVPKTKRIRKPMKPAKAAKVKKVKGVQKLTPHVSMGMRAK